MRKTFLFDLDDTLMGNMHDYSQPILDFVKLVINRIGPRAPDIPSIVNLQAEIDANKVKEWIPMGKGFCKERFPSSMAETYHEIAKTLNITDPEGERLSYEIGTNAFSLERWKKQGLLPHAKKILNYLQKKGDEIILVTKGDQEIQKSKISANNLEKVFKEIYIVPTKDKKVLEEIIGERNKDYIWHVGNSIKSDILPAIESGVGAIYIPLETWKFEKEHAPLPEYGRLIKIDKISQIKNIYPDL